MLRNTSLNRLVKEIKNMLEGSEYADALKKVHDSVLQIITEPLCTSQVFGSRTLDELCQEIGSENLKYLSLDASESIPDENVFVYIVTKIQNSGGHTRVISDFIAARPEDRHIILATGLAGFSDAAFLKSRHGPNVSVSFEEAKGDMQTRLTWLQNRLLEVMPQKVYLFNHHQDSVAVAAVQPSMGLDAYFCHHGDHHLCLGVYLDHMTHIDLHPMGYNYCRHYLGIENIYVPLSVRDHTYQKDDWVGGTDRSITTCTAARSNKVEQSYFVSYIELLPQILARTRGKHVHIGRLTPWALWRIRRGLDKVGVDREKFIYVPWVSSVWDTLQEYRVDLYLSSFPHGGALTLVEAMGAGVPIVLHHHMYSKILGCIELGYPGAFCWRTPNELLEYCDSLDAELLKLEGVEARRHYLKYHTGEDLKDLLNETLHLTPSAYKDYGDIGAQYDEWAIWFSSQISLRGILFRKVYRIVRWLRLRLQSMCN